jgi:hypothetical protein
MEENQLLGQQVLNHNTAGQLVQKVNYVFYLNLSLIIVNEPTYEDIDNIQSKQAHPEIPEIEANDGKITHDL